jgi:hypothetical protein
MISGNDSKETGGLVAAHPSTTPENTPRKHRPYSRLTFFPPKNEDSPVILKSCHDVKLAELKEKTIFYKAYPPGSRRPELEAANTAILQFLAPGYCPEKVYVFYDETGIRAIGTLAIPNFVTVSKDKLTEDDLLDPAIVKGNAIGLRASYVLDEGDLHIDQIDKRGRRVDLGGLNYTVTGQFEDGNSTSNPLSNNLVSHAVVSAVNRNTRPHDPSMFPKTKQDILNFPHLYDVKLGYWVTQTQSRVAKILCLPTKTFSEDKVAVYEKLNKIDEFHNECFKFDLRFMMMSEHDIRNIGSQFITVSSADHQFQEKDKPRELLDTWCERIMENQRELRSVLTHLKEFQNFLGKHGQTALKEILAGINLQNDAMTADEKRKTAKNPDRDTTILINNYIDTTAMEQVYLAILDEAEAAMAPMTSPTLKKL